MCGIAGSLSWDEPDPEENLSPVVEALTHRGPDAGNIITSGAITLGHRRLSIIDTRSIANQPMQDGTNRSWIVFNGEIYNFRQIRSELEQKGINFHTNSDTEIILEAWKAWHTECLQRFVGMFAFAIWDSEEQELFLARDRMGEKPLYYTPYNNDLKNGIIFASELQALLKHPKSSKEINPHAISQFLSLNYILTDSCIIKDVYKLPPAHYLYIRKNRPPELKRYWDLAELFHHKSRYKSEQEAVEELNGLIAESVSGQLISDVPLGAFLSGGVDSSAVVSAMTRIGNAAETRSFSIDFTEKSYSELEYSKQVAQYLGVDHHTKTVSADILNTLPGIIAAADEPFADTSMIPMYFLSEFTREQVTVALSGDGADELFAGYETNVADRMHKVFSRLPKPVIKSMLFMARKLIPTSFNKVSFDYKLRQFLQGCLLDFRQAHYSWRQIFSEQEKQALVNPENSELLEHNPFECFNKFFMEVEGRDIIDQSAYVDMKTWLADDILVKVDRMAMAHSLETRAPFLDHRLVEFAARLPVDLRMKGRNKKYILKQSQRDFLPDNILNRKKRGFNAPVSIWLDGEFQNFAREVTMDSALGEWFNRNEIDRLWQEHTQKHKDNGLKLFGLMCLGMWFDRMEG